jgi:hypothetical protein
MQRSIQASNAGGSSTLEACSRSRTLGARRGELKISEKSACTFAHSPYPALQ